MGYAPYAQKAITPVVVHWLFHTRTECLISYCTNVRLDWPSAASLRSSQAYTGRCCFVSDFESLQQSPQPRKGAGIGGLQVFTENDVGRRVLNVCYVCPGALACTLEFPLRTALATTLSMTLVAHALSFKRYACQVCFGAPLKKQNLAVFVVGSRINSLSIACRQGSARAVGRQGKYIGKLQKNATRTEVWFFVLFGRRKWSSVSGGSMFAYKLGTAVCPHGQIKSTSILLCMKDLACVVLTRCPAEGGSKSPAGRFPFFFSRWESCICCSFSSPSRYGTGKVLGSGRTISGYGH